MPAAGARLGVQVTLAWYQLLERLRSPCQLLGGSSAAAHWGGNGVCPKKQLAGGTCMSEASEGLSARAWREPCDRC